jgi:hypothetical protein
MKKNDQNDLPSNQDIEKYDLLNDMFNAIFVEMKQFSKSKQETALNKFKVKKINEILIKIKDLLSTQPTIVFLELLDDVTLPMYSDAVLILAQYRAALDKFKEKYLLKEGDDFFSQYRWRTKENP